MDLFRARKVKMRYFFTSLQNFKISSLCHILDAATARSMTGVVFTALLRISLYPAIAHIPLLRHCAYPFTPSLHLFLYPAIALVFYLVIPRAVAESSQ